MEQQRCAGTNYGVGGAQINLWELHKLVLVIATLVASQWLWIRTVFAVVLKEAAPAHLPACLPCTLVTTLALTLEEVGNIRKLPISLQQLYLGRIQFFFPVNVCNCAALAPIQEPFH